MNSNFLTINLTFTLLYYLLIFILFHFRWSHSISNEKKLLVECNEPNSVCCVYADIRRFCQESRFHLNFYFCHWKWLTHNPMKASVLQMKKPNIVEYLKYERNWSKCQIYWKSSDHNKVMARSKHFIPQSSAFSFTNKTRNICFYLLSKYDKHASSTSRAKRESWSTAHK